MMCIKDPKLNNMSCIASTYDASGKLVGCTEQELNGIVSMQLYTMIALGAGLYAYKTFTADNWVDIALEIGWGCVSAFTHTRRFTTRYIVPVVNGAFSFFKQQVVMQIRMMTIAMCASSKMELKFKGIAPFTD